MIKNANKLKNAIIESAEMNYNIWETLGWLLGEFGLYLYDKKQKDLRKAIEKILKNTNK